MRCEDCMTLIEEYFDGEVDTRTSERMSAHLSACADCSAALDALSFEQEIYARYDRKLEVAPALWAAVSAEIAREPKASERAARRPFLSGLREAAAAAFAMLAPRTAFAPTLALLFVGVAAGALWLARNPQPATKTLVAENTSNATPGGSAVTPSEIPSTVATGAHEGDSVKSPTVPPVESIENASDKAPTGKGFPPSPEGARLERGGRALTPEELANLQLAHAKNDDTVVIAADEHSKLEALIVDDARQDAGVVLTNAQSLNTGEREVARHVEQAQMLLRSIKNAKPSDDDTINVAYEKKLSRKLLADNATLQLEAEVKGDKDTKQVLDQIEPFLLDIANMRDKPSREEVRSLKERVKKDEIIAALQVY